MTKAELRKFWRLQNQSKDKSARELAAQALQQNLHRWLEIRSPSRIAAFRAKGVEAGIESLLLKPSRHTWAFPRTLPEGQMEFRQAAVPLVSGEFELSRLGIWEPKKELTNLQEFDLILVPLIAFDGKGMRLGQGLGFYDRFLASQDSLAVGIAFSWQESKELLIAESHDQPLDGVCTEFGIRTF